MARKYPETYQYTRLVNRIGSNIRALRERDGITQKTFSEDIGISLNYITLIENGHRCLRLEGLCMVATYFQVPVGSLLDRDYSS